MTLTLPHPLPQTRWYSVITDQARNFDRISDDLSLCSESYVLATRTQWRRDIHVPRTAVVRRRSRLVVQNATARQRSKHIRDPPWDAWQLA